MPRSTLTAVPDSMLGAMFSGRHSLRTDDNGRAYLDRSANHFDYILDYFRNGGALPAPPDSNQELERVRAGTRVSPSHSIRAKLSLIFRACSPQ